MIKVLFVTSEATPFFSTGGLGDVSGSLPAALSAAGADVRIVMPMYRPVKEKYYDETSSVYEGRVDLSWRNQYLGIRKTEYKGVTYYFIDNEYYFKRETAYGNYDEGERFAFFGKSVCELIARGIFEPDILHANDWQSALSVIYLKRQYSSLSGIRCVFTIHNIEYQGKYDPVISGDVFGFSDADRDAVIWCNDLNLLKGAVCHCDVLTTVSPSYADEIKNGRNAFGLEYLIAGKGIVGILNGIDKDEYDPSTDKSIPFRYSATRIFPKEKNKKALCELFGLSYEEKKPLIGIVSRLVPQKGIDLLTAVIEQTVKEGTASLATLGKGYPEYEQFFRYLSEKYPGAVGYVDRFDRTLSHIVFAGSDMFLMPSLFEPCGISQLIAQRYGSVPIVRETGGLKDTVKPYNEYTGEGDGFSFANYNTSEMKNTIEYAASFFGKKEVWAEIVKNAMKVDNGWERSAAEYYRLYSGLIG